MERKTLVDVDSEMSAIAHGRPVDKDELKRIYPKVRDICDQIAKVMAKKGVKVPATHEDVAVGAWLSAALEDHQVCDEMKRDVNAWFDTKIYPRESGHE